MKFLILTTSSNNTTTVIQSLGTLKIGDVVAMQYDKKWLQTCAEAVQQNKDILADLQAGQWPKPEHREGMRERVSMDADIIRCVQEQKPDVIFYISAWEGLFVPKNETLKEIGLSAPLVHICFDASDPPWHGQMLEFERQGIFKLTVNIDGGHCWPGGKYWPVDQGWKTEGLTLLTPLDPRYFNGANIPFSQRAFSIGYAGNAGGWLRHALVTKLQHKGYAVKQRDDRPDSYGQYCQFLKQCKVSVSVPFTGSTEAVHVKGRVLETGYAGAALLEWENPATREWFLPRYHFWEYRSVEECIEMVEWLEKHPKICEEMAAALHKEVTSNHSPQAFWAKVLSRLDIIPPIDPAIGVALQP